MDTSLLAMIELWKKITTQNGTTSRRLCLGPCFLFYANAWVYGSGVGFLLFLNGGDDSGENLASLLIPGNDTRQFQPPKPVFYDKGLYVSTAWTEGRWTVQFVRISELPSLDAGEP